MSGFSSLMVSLAGPVVKKALAALGFGILTFAAVQAAFSTAQSALLASYGQISADILGPLEMAGFGQAVGIILGALGARLSVQAMSKLGRIAA